MTRWQWFRFWLASPRRLRTFVVLRYYEASKVVMERWLAHKVRQNNRWLREGDPRGRFFKYR